MILWISAAACALFILPVLGSTIFYFAADDVVDWRTADRTSVGLLRVAREHEDAVVRIFSARTVRWRGIFATHSWIVVKPKGGSAYRRFDYTAWGEPIWIDRFVPDGRWFGKTPELVYAADGPVAERMIPALEDAVRNYPYKNPGDYRAWPGPNSNTFVAAVVGTVPGMAVVLPPTAIGKDYPFDNSWIGRSSSGSGFRISLGGYIGIAIGWLEGIEINLLGAVIGIDILRPALKLPAIGRVSLFPSRRDEPKPN